MAILIVDDIKVTRQQIKDMLLLAGHVDISTVGSAKEAFKLLGLSSSKAPAIQVDLILMDIMMPDIDGLEACRKIKETSFLEDVPVIIITARTDDESLQEGFESGAIDYITKPVNKVDLLSRVRSALLLKREMDRRKANEQDLRKAMERLRSFEMAVENMKLGLTITDKTGNIIYSNPADAEMHGYKIEELPGKRARIFGPSRLWNEISEEQLNQLGRLKRETTNIRKDGSLFPVQLTSSVSRDNDGRPISVVTVCEDIAERKEADRALRLLIESFVGRAGQEFFSHVVSKTCAWLGTDCAIIGELVDKNNIEALAMVLNGKEVSHFSYSLSGTPCENASESGFCIYSDKVSELFPDDGSLVNMGARGFIGIPLKDEKGKTIGIFSAISSHELNLPPSAREVMEIIAAKASAELEHKKAKRELENYHEKLEDMVAERTADLLKAQMQLKSLSGKILTAHEEERKRLARELHDGLGQSLLAVKLGLQMNKANIKKGTADSGVETNKKLIEDVSACIDELRSIAMDIRPSFIEDAELGSVIKLHANKFQDTTGIKTFIDIKNACNVNSMITDNMFRICQEALNNVSKHSEARSVKIMLKQKGAKLIMVISDNGKGCDLNKYNEENGLGLSTMRERAELLGGSIRLESSKGNGFLVEVEAIIS